MVRTLMTVAINNGIKVGLMGPLAGVGDNFLGTVRPVFAALGAGIAMTGSLLGPSSVFICLILSVC